MPLVSGQRISAATAPGFVAENIRTAPVAVTGGASAPVETVIQSITITAVPGARYRVYAIPTYQSTVAGDLAQITLRYTLGATLSTSGTSLLTLAPNCDVAAKGNPVPLVGSVTGLTGQVTFGITGNRNSGTGAVSFYAAAGNQAILRVERE